jgi:hypothetical protein
MLRGIRIGEQLREPGWREQGIHRCDH